MKEKTKDLIVIGVIIIASYFMGVLVERYPANKTCQSCTNLTAQIDEVQRTQGNHAQWIQENENDIIRLTEELTGVEYYDFVPADDWCFICHVK